MKTLKVIIFAFFVFYALRMCTSCTKTGIGGKVIPLSDVLATPSTDSFTYDTTYYGSGVLINDFVFPGRDSIDSAVFTIRVDMHSSSLITRYDEISYNGIINHFDDGGATSYSNAQIARWNVSPSTFHYFSQDAIRGAILTSTTDESTDSTTLSLTYYFKH